MEKFTIQVPKLIWDVYLDIEATTGGEDINTGILRQRLADYTAWLSEYGFDFETPKPVKKARKPRKVKNFAPPASEAPKKRGRKAKELPPGAVPPGGPPKHVDLAKE